MNDMAVARQSFTTEWWSNNRQALVKLVKTVSRGAVAGLNLASMRS